MVQIIQSQPTKRQSALMDSIGQFANNFGQSYMDGQKTMRQQALADQDTAIKLNMAGYEVNQDQVAQARQGGIGNLFANRTQEYTDKMNLEKAKYQRDEEDRQRNIKVQESTLRNNERNFSYQQQKDARDFGLKQQELGIKQGEKLAEKNKENETLMVPGYGIARTPKEALDIRTAKADSDDAAAIIDQLKNLGTNVNITDRSTIAKIGQLKTVLAGKLRLPLTGPGAMTEDEFQRLVSNIGDPSDVFSTEEIQKGKLDQLKEILKKSIDSKFANASSQPYTPSKDWDNQTKKMALNPVSTNTPYAPTSVPNMSPIQNANASGFDMTKVPTESLQSRREQLLQKNGGR